MICSVDGCDSPVKAGGLCNRHYIRSRKHGDPLGGAPQQDRSPLVSGTVFGRLTIVELCGHAADGARIYLCECRCGTRTKVTGRRLKNGSTQSCGCLRRERLTRHGHADKHPLYQTWTQMRKRCFNPAAKDYPLYGGRGITVDPRWDDFAAFLADMGERPEGTTLDRRDNDGNYSPENCRWATPKQQRANQRVRPPVGDSAGT